MVATAVASPSADPEPVAPTVAVALALSLWEPEPELPASSPQPTSSINPASTFVPLHADMETSIAREPSRVTPKAFALCANRRPVRRGGPKQDPEGTRTTVFDGPRLTFHAWDEVRVHRLEPSSSSMTPRPPETEVATLRWLDGCAAGRVHVLDRSVTVIGRDQSCRIIVEDDGIAERHAEIHSALGRRPVLMGSSGADTTRVNGRVVQEAPLRDGDVVLLGPTAAARFEYRGVRRVRIPDPGLPTLSAADREIASHFVRGRRDEQIAHALGLPTRRVTERVARLHQRFETTARVDLIAALVDEQRSPGSCDSM